MAAFYIGEGSSNKGAPTQTKKGVKQKPRFKPNFDSAVILFEKIKKLEFLVHECEQRVHVIDSPKNGHDVNASSQLFPNFKYGMAHSRYEPAKNFEGKWGQKLETPYSIQEVGEPVFQLTGFTIPVESFEDFKSFDKFNCEFNKKCKRDRIYLLDDKITLIAEDSEFKKFPTTTYYRNFTNKTALTLNIRTGNIYIVTTGRGAICRRKKRITKNQFKHLRYFEQENNFDPDSVKFFIDYLIKEYQLDVSRHPSLYEVLAKWFVKFHKIKVNNNYIDNLTNFYPTLRILKRKKMNLTNAIMYRFKLRGDKIKKIINTNDTIDFMKLNYYFTLIGIDLFNTLDNKVIFEAIRSDNKTPLSYHNTFIDKDIKEQMFKVKNFGLSKSEINKIIKIIDKVGTTEIEDHVKFRFDIFELTGKNIKFSFRNYEEFHEEHMMFTRILEQLRRKYITVINSYNEEFINLIEAPVNIQYEAITNDTRTLESKEFTVRLLRDSIEYTEEGLYQSHCVGGYINRSSHIISLRSDKVRCTIEFNEAGRKVQNQMRGNTSPDKEWMQAITIIEARIRETVFGETYPKKVTEQVTNSIEKIMESLKLDSDKTSLPNPRQQLPAVVRNGVVRRDVQVVDYNLVDFEMF